MQVSVENTNALERRMTVQVPAERVDNEVKSRLESMTKTVRMDGFRPGKVPFKVVEKKYGQQVRLETMGEVISATYQEALTQQNLVPAGEPSIEPSMNEPGQVLEYVATFEIFPEIEPADMNGVAITKVTAEVVDGDVDKMLEKLQKQRTNWEDTEAAATDGDRVIIDFEGTIDGEAFSGNKASNVPLELGSNSMIPGFEEQLVGAKAGEERTLKVTFPDDYGHAEVAGKAAEFAVKVDSVQTASLPELDDAFAQAFGVGDKGMDGLREEVRKNMERELAQTVRNKVKRDVFDALLEQNSIDVPKSMLDSEISTLEKQASQQGLPAKDRAQYEEEATRRVKLGLLISEIVKRNSLQVDPERVRSEVESIAASYEKPEEVVQYYFSNQEALAGVQSYVMEDVVTDWLLDQMQVTEENASFEDVMQPA